MVPGVATPLTLDDRETSDSDPCVDEEDKEETGRYLSGFVVRGVHSIRPSFTVQLKF